VFNPKRELSTEMIDFQTKALFFKELTELYNEAIGKDRKSLFKMELDRQLSYVIRQHTKLANIKVLMGSENNSENDFTEFHTLINFQKLVKIKNLRVGFSYKTGFFTGDTKEIFIRVCIPLSLLIESRLTGAECAAITLHEIGHTAFQVNFFARQLRTNLALEYIASELKGQSLKERTMVYRRALEIADIHNLKVEELVGNTDPKSVVVIFTNSLMNDYRSELASSQYDRTMEEYYADMYATRQGAGLALTSALGKFEHMYSDFDLRRAARMAGSFSILLSAITMVAFPAALLGASVVAGIWALALSATVVPTAGEFRYDDSYTRIKRIRQQVSALLQKKSLSKSEVSETVAELKHLDRMLEGFEAGSNPFTDFFIQIFSKNARARLSAQEIQNAYEQYAYNTLFEKSAVLRSLS